MIQKLALEPGNSEDLAFAYACLVYGAVSFEEFIQWAFYVIENTENFPDYFLNIIDLKQRYELKPSDTFGFDPVWSHRNLEMKIIMAIGFKRGIKKAEDIIKRAEQEKYLKNDKNIISRFYNTFPFLREKDEFNGVYF